MSALDLEAKQWQAICDAVWLRRDDLAVTVIPQNKPGEVIVRLGRLGWMDSEEWKILCGDKEKSELLFSCTVAEWQEMLAQGVG